MRLLLFAVLVAVSRAAILAPLYKHDEKIAGDYIVVLKVSLLF